MPEFILRPYIWRMSSKRINIVSIKMVDLKGELLGIKLLDHLIIGDGFPALRSKCPTLVGYGAFTSLKEKGYL